MGNKALCLCVLILGCSSDDSTTDLNTAGPPMIRQVFVEELNQNLLQTGLAFGDHPQFTDVDDHMVTRAVANATQEIRIVFDELLRGNPLEELRCADGSYSLVPEGTTPDDVAKCSGTGAQLSRCKGEHAVCLTAGGTAIGVLDANGDGAADEFRMVDYTGQNCDDPTLPNVMGVSDDSSRELGVRLSCGGVDIPVSCSNSFYNPSGNQLLPTTGKEPELSRRLGPAIVLKPRGLRTSSTCELSFRSEVVDKDGETVCAPPDGDVAQACTPGDTSIIKFVSDALRLTSSNPVPNAMQVPLRNMGTDATVRVNFNAELALASLVGITLNDGVVDVPVTRTISNDGSTATLLVAGGYAAGTTYTVTVGTGLTDLYGSPFPTASSFTFTTATAPAFVTSTPATGATGVAVTNDGANFVVQLVFDSATRIDGATLNAITLNDGTNDVVVARTLDSTDAMGETVLLTVTGGLTAATTYTVTIGTGLLNLGRAPLPAVVTVTFST